MIKKTTLSILCILSFSALKADTTDYNAEISPTTFQLTRYYLDNFHYAPKEINEEFSNSVFDRFLSSIDPMKTIFSMEEYTYLKNEFGSIIASIYFHSNVNIFNELYNSYLASYDSMGNDYVNILNNISNSDFDNNKKYEVNRKNTSYAEQSKLYERRQEFIKSRLINNFVQNSDLSELIDSMINLYENRRKPINQEEFVYRFLDSTAKEFDTHTAFFSPVNSESFQIEMSGKLMGGVGLALSENQFGQIFVSNVIQNGPSYNTEKINSGFVLVSFKEENSDIIDVGNMSLNQVVGHLRGEKGTPITLFFQDNSMNIVEVEIIRDTIDLAAADDSLNVNIDVIETDSADVGYIKIPTFYDDFSSEDGRSVAEDFTDLMFHEAKYTDGLIIDLRNNGGGSLRSVVQMLGHFIPEQVVTQVLDSQDNIDQLIAPRYKYIYENPVMVIINGQSASASEIFAAAIQDYGIGVVVGENTLGKGTVQQLIPVEDSQIKITTSKFFRPNGKSVQALGVIPDIKFLNQYPQNIFGEISQPNYIETSTIDTSDFNRVNNLADLIYEINYLNNSLYDNSDIFWLNEYYEANNDFSYADYISIDYDDRKNEYDTYQSKVLSIVNSYLESVNETTFNSFSDYQKNDDLIFDDVVKNYSINLFLGTL